MSLGINIDWSTVDGRDISPDVPYQGFAHEALSRADFGSSMIRHPKKIAAFISAITPNVDEVVAWNSGSHKSHLDFKKYSARWRLVQSLIRSSSQQENNVGEGVVYPEQVTANGEMATDSNIGGDEEVLEDENSDQASSDLGEEE